MAGAGEGGPVRLAILLGSLASLLLLGLHTIGGAASASHRLETARAPGKIAALAARRGLPLSVRRQLGIPRAPGVATIPTSHGIYLVGGSRRGAKGARVPIATVRRATGNGRPTRVARLPVPINDAAGAAVGDRIYALGGLVASGRPTNLIQVYDVSTRRSAIAGRLPEPVADGAALTLDGFVFLAGGLVDGSPTRAIVRFDPHRRSGVLAGHLPVAASGGVPAASRARRGYLVGAAVPGDSSLNLELTLRTRGH
jgi:hypothetical protein